MSKSRRLQIKRNILMVVGAIVVLIILMYAYVEITAHPHKARSVIEIKKELNDDLLDIGRSTKVFPSQKFYLN